MDNQWGYVECPIRTIVHPFHIYITRLATTRKMETIPKATRVLSVYLFHFTILPNGDSYSFNLILNLQEPRGVLWKYLSCKYIYVPYVYTVQARTLILYIGYCLSLLVSYIYIMSLRRIINQRRIINHRLASSNEHRCPWVNPSYEGVTSDYIKQLNTIIFDFNCLDPKI